MLQRVACGNLSCYVIHSSQLGTYYLFLRRGGEGEGEGGLRLFEAARTACQILT